MKLRKIITVLLLACCATACDYLDKTPDEDLTIKDVFTRREWIRAYISNIYSWLPNENHFADDGGFRNPFVGGSDEMEIAFGEAYSHLINAGTWNSSNVGRVPIWTEAWCSVRCCNIFLANIDGSNQDPDEIREWKGEIYFLRAFYHFLALRAYGPIPLIDHVVEVEDDMSEILRQPFDRCVEFIAADCDRAAGCLPPTRSTTDYGRPVRAAALALKARLLLYAASPLYNGNPELAGLKDPQTGECLIPQVPDPEKWKLAADAAREALDEVDGSGFYGLYRSSSNDPVKNYEEIFTVNWNREVLFGKNLGDDLHHIWCSDPVSFGLPSIFNPTQEMVDCYRMENGSRPITGYTGNGLEPVINPASGYVEEGYAAAARAGRWPAGVRNMYVNREPRFYASINYPGQIWKLNHELAFWYEGVDGKRNAGSDYCKTGYLMRKINNINITFQPWAVQKPVWIYFRVGELYLNLAEACNEYAGPGAEVYAALNEIRNRSGLDDLPEGLSQTQMREEIKLERRIELAFETHRFFDVRRWKDAPQTEARPIHSLDIWRGTQRQDDAFYRRIVCEDRIFESPKHYLFPIPQEEINKNPRKLVQNLEW